MTIADLKKGEEQRIKDLKEFKKDREERIDKQLNRVKSIKFLIDDYWEKCRESELVEESFIHDMLYCIGVSIDSERFCMADGYSEFKKYLKEIL